MSWIKKNRRNLILIGLAFLIVILGYIIKGEGKKSPIKSEKVEDKYVATPLCDGYDWRRIDSFNILSVQKDQIKEDLIKIVIESSAFSGKPIFRGRASLRKYKDYIESFYQKEKNLQIPLFFALKMVDMEISGTPPRIVEMYKSAIVKKLKDVRMIK